MVRAVLFDYGDTLVRARMPEQRILARALRRSYDSLKTSGLRLGYEQFLEIDRSVFAKYSLIERSERRDIPDLVKYVELVGHSLGSLSLARRRVIAARANEAFWNEIAHCHRLNVGVKPSLAKLQEMGIRMAVVSNHHNPSALRKHLSELGTSPFFSTILASSDMRYRKPDPRIFRKALSALRRKPGESVFVGDSMTNDVRGAKGVGMYAVLVEKPGEPSSEDPGYEAIPDFRVPDLRGIPRIVGRLNR